MGDHNVVGAGRQVAIFGSVGGEDLTGRPLLLDGGQFSISGRGPIAASQVAQYERDGLLNWSDTDIRDRLLIARPAPRSRTESGLETVSQVGVWRCSNLLVTHPAAGHIDKCVMSGAPANGNTLTMKFLGPIQPTWYLFLLLGLLPGILIIHFIRPRAVLTFGLSLASETEVRKWGRRYNVLLAALFIIPIAGVISAAWLPTSMGSPASSIALIATVAAFIAMLVSDRKAKASLRAVKMDQGFVWVSGVHPGVLEFAPEWGPDEPERRF